jgi:hypothetical protein
MFCYRGQVGSCWGDWEAEGQVVGAAGLMQSGGGAGEEYCGAAGRSGDDDSDGWVESSAMLLKYHPARTSQLCELTLMLMRC